MLVLPELYSIFMLGVTLILLAKTNYIPSSFRMAGVCPHFCHTFFCVERIKLIRPKDTVGQYLQMPESQQGGWVGVLNLWQEDVVFCRLNKPCFAGVGGTAVQSRGGPGSLVLGGGFVCLHGLWQDSEVCASSPSLFSALHSLPPSGSFQLPQKAADLSVCTSCPCPGPCWHWVCPEPGEEEQLSSLWAGSFSCPFVSVGEVCAKDIFFFLRAADGVTAPHPHEAEAHFFL